MLHTASEIMSVSIPLIRRQVSSRSCSSADFAALLFASAFQTFEADIFPKAFPCDLPFE